MKKLNKKKKEIIEDETVRELQKEVKKLENESKTKHKQRIYELKQIIRLTKKQNEETYSEQLEEIEEDLEDLRKEVLLYPDKSQHRQFYNENNSRNSCLYNKSKITHSLESLDIEYSQKLDHILSKRLQGFDPEHSIIYDIEREKYEQLDDRLDEIMEEVKEYFKSKDKT